MSPPGAPRRCPICDTEPRRSFRLPNRAWLLRCPRCSLGWWPWPAFEAERFYDRDYFQSPATPRGYDDYLALEPGLRRTARSRLRRIAGLLRPAARAARLFDVGCGTGCFLAEARQAGWEVAGCEISAFASAEARRRGLPVQRDPAERLELPPGYYDCITLWDVIEHLRDPVGVLTSAARALRRGGVLALSTGDVNSACARLCGPRWHLFNLPEHLFFFSLPALRKVLGRLGCPPGRVTREVNWVPASYLLERLGTPRARRWLRARMPAAARAVVPASLFDVLGVYAIRRWSGNGKSSCPVSAREL